MPEHTSPCIAAELWEHYAYNPLTGKLYDIDKGAYIEGSIHSGRTKYRTLRMSVRFKGKTAVCNYSRVVYAWFYGNYPAPGYHVDHINHNTYDNRIANLRCVTPRENNQNRRNQKIPGVYWNRNKQKWQAQIRVGSKRVYLGLHSSKHAALQAYVEACDFNNFPVLPSLREMLVSLASP